MRKRFDCFAAWVTEATGSPVAFVGACGIVLVWLLGAWLKDLWTDTVYSFIINDTTTIITFLMVFAVQATQNRNDKAIHCKLDELLRASKRADNRLIGVERPDKEA